MAHIHVTCLLTLAFVHVVSVQLVTKPPIFTRFRLTVGLNMSVFYSLPGALLRCV